MLEPAKDITDLVKGRVDMPTLAQKILVQFGGLDGLVHKLQEEYDAIDPGHKLRLEILKVILALLGQTAAKGAEDDLADAEALEQERLLLEAHLAETGTGPGSDGGAVGPEAAPQWELDEAGESPY